MKKTKIQRKPPSKNPREGATIVETIVALVLFAMFITGATKVIMSHRQLTDKARAHYTAINIAKNRIEQMRNIRYADYEQIKAMIEPGTEVDADGDSVAINKGKFRRITTIEPDASNEYRLKIKVKVEIRNPISLEFSGEEEHINSYMARLL